MWPVIPKNVVFDLDDVQDSASGLSELLYLKQLYPKFKCTLFAIPDRCSETLLAIYDKLDWIELAVHGWDHHDNYEAEKWSKEECLKCLRGAESKYPNFVKGFKAPGWQISDGCYEALVEQGYWVADQDYNNGRRPKELPAYLLSHPWSVHGHTWDILGVPKDQQNGIRQLIYERELKFDQDTEFYFISEIVEKKPEYNVEKELLQRGLLFSGVGAKDRKEVKNAKDNHNSDNQNGLSGEKPRDVVEVQPDGRDEGDSSGCVNVWDL